MEPAPHSAIKTHPNDGLALLWHKARQIFLSSLKARDANKEALRDEATLDDTLESLRQAQKKAAADYGAKFVGTPIEFKLGRVLQRLEYLLKMGDEAMCYAPETASYVWAAFRMVFSGFLKDFKTCTFLVNAVDIMSDIIFICNIYAKRQLKKLPVSTDVVQMLADKILEKIPALLALVLKFAYETRKLVVDRPSLVRTLCVVFGSTEELTEILTDAERSRDELHRVSDIAFSEAALEILSETREDSKAVRKFLQTTEEELVPAMKKIQNDLAKQIEAQTNRELEEDFNLQMKWLWSGTTAEPNLPRTVLQENIDRRYRNTCKWIEEDGTFRQWLESHDGETKDRLLWLVGESGFGKSIMMSSVIKWLEDREPEQEKDRPIILCFFCKTGNDATQRGNRIMLHLLSQLFSSAKTEPPKKSKSAKDETSHDCRKACVDHVKEARNSAREPILTTFKNFQADSGMRPLVVDLAKALKRRVYIVVDGLDECSDWSDGFLDALLGIVDADIDIRVLISSRPHQELVDKLYCYPSIEVAKASTSKDVEAYISDSLKTVRRFNMEQRRFACARIAAKADGMFRYASLAVENFKGSKALSTPFKMLMDKLPDGMAGLYRQELQTLLLDDRDLLMVALRWMVCAEGRISAVPIADELERSFSDGDDSDGDDADTSESADSGRDAIDNLKRVSRNLLRFDKENYITLQHASVREFVSGEEKNTPEEETLCRRCAERFGSVSTREAAPKHGHLFMAIHCLKNLNSRKFQDKFLPKSILERHELAKLLDVSPSEVKAASEDDPVAEASENSDDESDGDDSVEYVLTEAETVTGGQAIDEAAANEEVLRYELTHWHYHVREAERLWPQDKRDGNQWETLYDEMDTFLNEDLDAFKIWQKCVLNFRALKSFDHPMHMASRFGLLHYMQEFIENGGDVNIVNENDCNPLHLACIGSGNWIGLEYLVEHGADINKVCTVDDETPLYCLIDNDGPADKLRYLLSKGGDPTIRMSDGWTALHLAIRWRNVEIIEAILEHQNPAVDVNAKDSDGETPLHWLLLRPNAPDNILRLLLAKNANVNEQDKNSQAPLYEACVTGNVEAARTLLKAGADVDDDEKTSGRTALHQAIISQNLPLVRVLLEFNADVTIKDKQLRDATSLAAHNDDAEILKAVLTALEARSDRSDSLTNPDITGRTPLHRAAARGQKEICELLLQAGDGAVLTSRLNRSGNTALYSAAKRGFLDVVRLLVDHGADPLAKSPDGNSPLQVAVARWRKRGLFDGERFRDLASYLADRVPKEAQASGPDLLDVAIESGTIEICRILVVQGGGIVSMEDQHGWTPLMLAMQTQQHDIIQLLAPFDTYQLLDKFSTRQEVLFGHKPSAWSKNELDKHHLLEVFDDELEVVRLNYTVRNDGICRANHPVPFGTSQYYYEITVTLLELSDGLVGLGFSNQYIFLDNMPGWELCAGPTWGYHGDDGGLFHRQNFNDLEGPKWSINDTVGCGVDFTKGTIFFTKNGEFVGDAFQEVTHGRLFPCVGIGPGRITIRANFGLDAKTPFKYDLKRYEDDAKKENGFKTISNK